MTDTTILLPLDMQTAQVYLSASAEEQQTMQLLLRVRLRELARLPSQSLQDIMNTIGLQAEAQGLTTDILEDLLHDE